MVHHVHLVRPGHRVGFAEGAATLQEAPVVAAMELRLRPAHTRRCLVPRPVLSRRELPVPLVLPLPVVCAGVHEYTRRGRTLVQATVGVTYVHLPRPVRHRATVAGVRAGVTVIVESDRAAHTPLRLRRHTRHRHRRVAGAMLQRILVHGAETGVDFEQRTP